ncbi:hypothetical protein OJAV_G00197350 [Oryzias javanicus]|uniref:Xin actin-binding repeat-containing protein 1-like n=1 Tax=Oryzias javanicus TaxID=123683 RepID=A0A437C861_ORYJA|nr:hypothetical protein OJAV_G00197350 [Oryzias javanicus]
MDWKNDLRRTQSMRSISSSTWTDTGLRDKMASVSELVARYQTSVSSSSGAKATSRHSTPGATKPESTPSPQPSRETSLEFLLRRNEERKQSGAQPSLTRSKSVGSLQNSSGSIEALKAVFEPKGAAKTKARSSFPPASATPNGMAEMPVVMNGEAEDTLSPAEGKKLLTENHIKYEHHENQKVGSQIQAEKRRTVGGIDFEKMAASQAEEKRKLFAEQRDNAVVHSKDVVSVSVRAISALYMSKVATQDSARKLSKPEQQQAFSSGKKTKLTKMEEDSHHTEVEDLPGTSSQPLVPSQLSRETLYKQRQKCELRRLLKHTHPELTMLDDFVDEELAEVWSSEEVAAGETGYEGEVLSRRLIFENRTLGDNALPSTLKIQTAQEEVERYDLNKTILEPQTERILEDNTLFNANLGLKKDSEEELKRIDVQAARRIFENQSQSTSRPNQDGSQGKVSMFGDEGSILEKQNKPSERKEKEHSGDKSSTNNVEEQLQVSRNEGVAQTSGLYSSEVVCSGETLTEEESLSDSGGHGKTIKTSAALFLNNPFISGNVEQEKSFDSESQNHQSVRAEDGLTVNVKNRTSLFESMPFDKIRHQNREEVETRVENIKETLSFLYHVKAIHSSGAIIEVNETMKAKRAQFLLSDSGPKIDYDDVTEGGAQNLILQLLPRTNLKPQITYLKENSEGRMQAVAVDVPHHQHQFSANRDTEFKTANVLQLVEDILNQDNSLRKGLIIQEDASNFTEVILYSLYKYFDEQDVKSYSPPQTSDKETVETIDASLKGQQICAELDMHGVKGNVKLFKDCIEKGDFEYLKTLQAGSDVQEEECSENQKLAGHEGDQADESNTEWVPVDIERLKSMFSKDKTNIQDAQISSAHVSNGSFAKSQSTENNRREVSCLEVKKECGSLTQEDTFCSVVPQLGEQVDINHAALTAELDTAHQVSTLQNAIHDLQQATIEAKLLYQSLQETQKIPLEGFSDKADVEPLGYLPQDEGQKVESCTEVVSHEFLAASKIIPQQDEVTETDRKDQKSEKGQMCDARNKKDQDDDMILKQEDQAGMTSVSTSQVSPAMDEEQEAVLQGKMQAALESLERSNINVTRGDFRAAMIYRNSHKPSQGNPQKLENEEVVTDSKSAQAPLKQEALIEIKKGEQEMEVKQEGKVEMREKAEQIQSEEDCRERLDEIVRGNITAAMEIFDNLQKQEQLQSILSRVEEIEKDTSEVDVRALRRAFESVPDWVVRPDKRKEKNREAENKDKRPAVPREKTDSSSSMAHVYGDLERASAEIMNLKEQTIARLLDIEDAIRKALYSVSTLKSDSDIASLSFLLKESFGQKASPAGRMGSHGANESYNTREIPVATETSSGSNQQSPPSTPSPIAIQSQETRLCPTCQQNSKEEKFRTTKTLICNSPAQDRRINSSKNGKNPDSPTSNREVSVLEVQTDCDGNGLASNSNHEKTGNHFYSSKTVMATQPEPIKSTSQEVFSPSTHQVSTYPEVQLPINQISTFKHK